MDNIAVGLIGLVSGLTLVFMFITYNKLVYVQRHVLLILRQLNIDPTKPPELSDRVRELARDPARKIEAIKVLRDETGAGLAEAKDAVESYIRTLDR